jgi:hypothetical protein
MFVIEMNCRLDRLKIISARHVTFVCYRANEEKAVEGHDRESLFHFQHLPGRTEKKQTDDYIYNFQTAVLKVTACTCVRAYKFGSSLIVKT